jgi:hypothetical protein
MGYKRAPATHLSSVYASVPHCEWRFYAYSPRFVAGKEGPTMADFVYVAVGLAFFALMGLYAYACDRL